MEIRIKPCLWGGSIDDALAKLNSAVYEIRKAMVLNGVEESLWRSIYTSMEFNGVVITSNDTIDEAYKKVTGYTKGELDERARKEREEDEREEQEFQDSIPSLIPEKCAMARGVVREDTLEYWDLIVPIRLSDLYHGMELDATIELLKEWNSSHNSEAVRKIFLNQGHSGMSGSLVLGMIKKFAIGPEEEVEKMVEYVTEY